MLKGDVSSCMLKEDAALRTCTVLAFELSAWPTHAVMKHCPVYCKAGCQAVQFDTWKRYGSVLQRLLLTVWPGCELPLLLRQLYAAACCCCCRMRQACLRSPFIYNLLHVPVAVCSVEEMAQSLPALDHPFVQRMI
jgi:hypothetical protein